MATSSSLASVCYEMSFRQLNLHKSKIATANLVEEAAKASNFIHCLQEPHVYKGSLPGYPSNANLYYSKESHPRTAIFGSKNLNLWFAPEFSSGDITTFIWKTEFTEIPEIFVVSVYLDIQLNDSKIIPSELLHLVKKCRENRKPLIVCADTNAHSTLWGTETNSRGTLVEDFIFGQDLTLENIGNMPTFIGRGTETSIDITLTMNLDSITNWHVSNKNMFSDHKMICFNLNLASNIPEKTRLYRKTDWKAFRKILEDYQYDLEGTAWDTQRIDNLAQSMTTNIALALDKTSSWSPRSNKYKSKAFWNEELYALKNKANCLYRKYMKAGSQENWDNYLTAKHMLQRELRRSKSKTWKDFCTNTKNVTETAQLNKLIHKKENRSIGLMKLDDGTETSNPVETLNLLLDVHFPGSLTMDSTNEEGGAHGGPEVNWDTKDTSFITIDKVRKSLADFGSHKAAGTDGIKPIVLQNLDVHTLRTLVQLYKVCIQTGYTPRCWRESKVIFIPKPGRRDYSRPKAFRPISLSSYFLKAMERLVLWELEDTVLKSNPLSKDQHAFRKGSSTDSALSDMVDNIERSILRKEFSLGVFLDIQGAFDNLDPASAIKGMKQKGFPSKILNWYRQYLLNRTIVTVIKGYSATRILTRGVPQGGVLSPLIWNIVFDTFLNIFRSGPVQAKGFADDAGLLASGLDPHTLVLQMQKSVDKAVNWGKENGLTFGAAKTVAVLFHRKKTKTVIPPIRMGSQEIDYSPTVKYLGVTLDSKLNFKFHIKDKISKAKGLMLKTKEAIGHLWGPSPTLTRWAYSGIVRPMLTYGSIVWAMEAGKFADAFSKLQRLAVLSMGHIRHSTPKTSLEVISNLMPLDLVVQELAIRTKLRIQDRNVSKWDGIGTSRIGHLKWIENKIDSFKLTHDFPIIHLKGQIRGELLKIWNKRWVNAKEARQTKVWFPEVDPGKADSLLKLNRVQYGQAVQFITGHNHLSYHMSKINPTTPKVCRLCQEEVETSFHLYARCPALGTWRYCEFFKITLEKVEWTCEKLNRFLKRNEVAALMSPPSQ